MASESLTKEEQDFVSGLRQEQSRGNLSNQDRQLLSDLEDAGDIPKRGMIDVLSEQTSGKVGTENAKSIGGVGTDMSGAYAGKVALGKLFGSKGKLLTRGAQGIGAALADFFGNQGAIQGVPMEDRSIAQSAVSGVSEVVIPGAIDGVKAVGKALNSIRKSSPGAEGSLLATPGNFFRNLIGRKGPTPSRTPTSVPGESDVAMESGAFIEGQAAKVRKGTLSSEGLAETTTKRIQEGKLVTSMSRQFSNRFVDLMDGVATGSIFGQKSMFDLALATQDILENKVTEFSRKFISTLTPKETAQFASQAIKGNVEFASSLRKANFIKLDFLSSKVDDFGGVDLSKFGKGEVSFAKAAEIADKASSANATKIKREMFKAAKKLDKSRTKVLSDSEKSELREQISDVPELAGNMDKIMASVSSANESLTKALAFGEKTARLFNTTAIKDVARTSPELFLEELYKSGRPDTIKAVMNLTDEFGKPVLSEKLKLGIRAAFLGTIKRGRSNSGLLDEASTRVGNVNVLIGTKLNDLISKFEGFGGEATSRALFPGTGLQPLKKMANFLEVQQRRGMDQTGSMSFLMKAPSAIESGVGSAFNIAGGTLGAAGIFDTVQGGDITTSALTMVGAGTILFTPKGMAMFLSNKKTLDTLLNGATKLSKSPSKLAEFFNTTMAQTLAQQFNATYIAEAPEDETALAPVSGAGSHQMTQ